MRSLALLAVLAFAAEAEELSNFDAGHENRAGLTFSPDGNTAYWVEWDGKWGHKGTSPRTIYMSVKKERGWSGPLPIPFSGGEDNDADPFVSPDGEWLYFVSDRPTEIGGEGSDGNIWRYRLHEGRQLELVDVNSPGEEYSPIVVSSGALYFASDRAGGFGQGDIYVAAANGDGFFGPTVLGTAINSEFGEWNLWVAPDESMMLFESSSRPTNVSVPGDIYGSIDCGGTWAPAVPMPSVIVNTKASELLPRMDPDSVTLYYTVAPIGGHAEIKSIPFAMSSSCDD